MTTTIMATVMDTAMVTVMVMTRFASGDSASRA
jgi:hypothetical protein